MKPPMKCSKTGKDKLDKEFWDERWKTNDTGWDLKEVSPPLKAYFNTLLNKDASILVPGCGSAYEAEYLLENGFTNVTVIDISPTLVKNLMERLERYAGKQLTIICGDFFRHEGRYDLIIEQTFFCALSPELRKAYAEKMYSLLNDDRKLVGLLFDKEFESGPPFGGTKQEYEELFSNYFIIDSMQPCLESATPRLGSELFVEMTKKDQA